MSAAVVKNEMTTDLMKEDLDDVDGPRVANGDIEVDVDDSMSSKMEKDGSDGEDYEKYKLSSTPFAHFATKHFNGNDSPFDLEMRQKFGIGREDTMSPETSKLLREILQSRERRMQLHLAAAGKMPLGFPNGNDHLMAKLYQRDPSLFHNGELDLDMSVLHQMGRPRNEGSSDESDQDIDKNQNKRSTIDSECSSPCVTSEQLSPCDGYEGSGPEAKLLKRARVENIITSMQLSPGPKSDSALTPPLEARRKRKQCQPMQHEGAKIDDPPTKVRRMERDDIRQQLTHMQQQLMDMQQKYLTLFDKDQSEAPDNTSDLENGDAKEKSDKINQNGIDKKDEKKSDKRRGWPVFGLDDEVEPHQFIDKVRKLVRDQEYGSHNDIDLKNMNLDQLAKLLKNEIRDAISNTVDSVVTKFLNQTSKTKTPAQTPLTDAANKLSTISSHQDHPKIEHPKPSKPKVTDRHAFRPPELIHNGFPETLHPLHHHTFPPLSFFPQAFQPPPHLPTYPKKEPEQTEALALVVNTPKKKRTKVTDTRLSPRAARALLHEPITSESEKPHMMMHLPHHHDIYPPIVPVTLPTSVAIPNPSLQHSDVLSMYSHTEHGGAFHHDSHSPPVGDHMSPSGAHTPLESLQLSMARQEQSESAFERSHCETPTYEASMQHMTSTLTPMHLRKAKLMFFYVRYPSSAILKVFFPDIKFNKNNTAQLVKWFSNFREFYYIQMEKYARQAMAEGVKSPEDLVVTTDSELYRVLNLHYNRNNQIEVPTSFRGVIEASLREFFKSIATGKDTEQSWKKAIYKIIARLDDVLPEYFKSPNWMEQLGEQ
ncbi:prospero homeobox protein 1-like [Lineus longissimus]|uniref:prospero homeobox protein 1-like n=1 Tax=Lineus longissimus TaxID=88925 RepID=UPI00315CE313